MSLVIANVTMIMMAILALKTLLNKEVEKNALQKALYIATGITGGLCLIFIFVAGSFSYTGLSDQQMAMQYWLNCYNRRKPAHQWSLHCSES